MASTRSPTHRPPRHTVCFSLFISLLLFASSAVAASHNAFLPKKIHTKPKSRSCSTWKASVGSALLHRKKYNAVTNLLAPSPLGIRGGEADTEYFHDETLSDDEGHDVTDADASAVNMTISEPNIQSASEAKGEDKYDEVIGDDEMVYVTIGVLNIPNGNTLVGKNNIMVSYNLNENQIYERWGIQSGGDNDKNNKNDLALSEINGCLCHGIVLNLSQEILISRTHSQDDLDDVLVCLAEGMIRRLKGTQQITIPLTITIEGLSENEKVNNYLVAVESTRKYIQGYLEHALHHVRKKHTEEKVTGLSNLEQCKVLVEISDKSTSEAATNLAKRILEEHSVDEISKQNIVPHSLFGTLCNQVYKEVHSSRNVHEGDEATWAEWKMLSQDIIATQSITEEGIGDSNVTTESKQRSDTITNISPDLKKRIETLMAILFVDAEESLLDIENKMDEAFLEFGEDDADYDDDESIEKFPMPEFGSDADAILRSMSASFEALVNECESLTESEKEWIEDQRLQTLKQVAETSILRLFNLHLQSLRDHFGHWYERMLQSSMVDEFNIEEESNGQGSKSWKVQSQKAAKKAEEGFMMAAFGSIPQICQHPEGELSEQLAGIFSCVEALRGLLEDMYEVTSTRGMEMEEWDAIMGDAGAEDSNDVLSSQIDAKRKRVGLRQLIKNVKTKLQKRGPAKWYERLALKALVIGVNYIQGYIVLQALRREARKRDLAMPKFPLF